MSVKIGHARGGDPSGTPGDQSGSEVCTGTWYNGGWTVLLRPKDSAVAEKMAAFCEAVCANNAVGYSQSTRNTLRIAARGANWDGRRIVTACNCDCSSFMSVCAEAAGIGMDSAYSYGNAPWTGNMREKFRNTGAFEVLTESQYLTQDACLKRGDVLVNEAQHTCMVLSNGSLAGSGTTPAASQDGDPAAYKVGDVVDFAGGVHFVSSDAAGGYPARAGKARITAIVSGAKHPYHLVHTDAVSNVYGWVNAGTFRKE